MTVITCDAVSADVFRCTVFNSSLIVQIMFAYGIQHCVCSAPSAVENGVKIETGREEGLWEGWRDATVCIQK